MFKTARFKVHNPSRHKQALLWYAMTRYHQTLDRVLNQVLLDPDLLSKASTPDKRGKLRLNSFTLAHLIREVVPKGWCLSPIRDYLINDATAMVSSHLSKQQKGKNKSNPPTMPSLKPITDEEFEVAYTSFTTEVDLPIKPQHEEKIEAARVQGHTRVAERLESIYKNWAVSSAAGQLLRKLEGALPHPIEFTRMEFQRGAMLARRGNDYYLMIRLFSKGHRFFDQKQLADGFLDWKTGEDLSGRTYPGIILPLEFSRDYHEHEYLQNGKPQSAKLIVKRGDSGTLEFYVHVAFEFTPESVIPESILGIDRGAAKIGSATVVDLAGNLVVSKLELEGTAFSAEMQRLRERISRLQKRGHQKSRVFRLRGRKADAVVGEYANRVVREAAKNRSQIAVEKIDATSMARFLTQSQFAKLNESLSYKAARLGLPAPVEVPAAYTSQTCARCSHRAPENRPKKDASGKALQAVFRCVACGYEANADDNASEIVALRALHQIQQGGKFQKFDKFQIWLKSLSGRDGQRATSASAQ